MSPSIANDAALQIALEQIRTAKAEGVAPGIVLADAGYGADGGFRAGPSELDLTDINATQDQSEKWPPSNRNRWPASSEYATSGYSTE